MTIFYYFIPILLYIVLSNDFIIQWFLRFFLASLGTSSGIIVSLLPVVYMVGKFSDKNDKKTSKKNDKN